MSVYTLSLTGFVREYTAMFESCQCHVSLRRCHGTRQSGKLYDCYSEFRSPVCAAALRRGARADETCLQERPSASSTTLRSTAAGSHALHPTPALPEIGKTTASRGGVTCHDTVRIAINSREFTIMYRHAIKHSPLFNSHEHMPASPAAAPARHHATTPPSRPPPARLERCQRSPLATSTSLCASRGGWVAAR